MASKCPNPLLLSAYLDGELSQKKWLRIALHVKRCASCREELAELERIKKQVASLPLKPAPEIGPYPEPLQKRKGKVLPWSLAAAAVILLLWGLSLQFQKTEVAEEYLRIHRQYEQQIAQSSQRLAELLEEGP